MPDKPDINSLDRFRKSSPRLVLETYSSCEVPAGCGGIVFRWKRADLPIEAQLRLWSPAVPRVWVDGEEKAAWLDLAAGPHRLALHWEKAPVGGPLLMAALLLPWQPGRRDDQTLWHSSGEGGWQHRLSEPEDGWQVGAGEGWAPLGVVSAPPAPTERGTARWLHERCVQAGAECLGVPESQAGEGRVWVRAAFALQGKG